MANVYFLLIIILELFISVSMAMTTILPLLFVVGVSMIKDILEDRKRYLSD